METKRWHKLLAIVLTLVMLASQMAMAPVLASADEGELQPGEVRTYKTATPVPGMVNTWDVKLRVEGRDDVQTQTTDIVLVIDRSGSMGGTSGRMAAAKTAAKSFIDYMIQNDPNLRIGIVSFANDASQDRTYSRNRTDLKNAVDGLTATGGTHTQAGLYTARTLMNTSTADRRFIVFLSDGEPTYSYEPVNWSNPTETLPGYYFDDGAKGNFTYKNYYAIYDGNHTTTRVGSGNLIRSSTATHNGSRYWPQEVGGTVYYPLDRSGNSNNRTYTAKNLYYVDNGLAAVRAASDTKGDAGFSGLFTIALSAGTEGTSILEQIATSPSMAYATGNPADLQSIYDAIGLEIATQHAINNAVITDEMGDGFQLISGSIAVTEGTTSVAPAGGGKNQTITWTISPYVSARIGTSDVRFAEMTYRIEITPGILTATPSTPAADPEHNLFLTNKSTDMTYKNFNGTPATAAFISPQVDPVLLKIKKILTDAQGNVIPTDPRLFNVKIEKAPVFAHTENLVVGADYVWLTTLRHEGRYDVTEIGVDGSPATLDQFDIYYTVDGTEGQDYFDVFHQTGGIPRGDITIVVRNRENAVRVSFNGSKTLTGRTDASVADSFKFKLTALNGAKMPASDEVTLTFNGNGTQNFSFGPIIYTLSDLGGQNSKVLTYEISEIKPSPGIPGIVYDSSLVRTVTVTLTKNAAGLIQASVSPASVSFDNSYGAGGSFLPAATKTLTGRNLAAGEFTFHLEKLIPGSSPQAWTLVESKTNLADGTIPFAAIHYTTADLGVHTYRIREDAAVPGGISHDPLEIIYTVTVTDNKDGSLNVAYSVPADTEFNNFYMASGSFTPQVTKALAGRPLENGEFSFQLRDGDGTLLQTVSNLTGGQVIFSAIPYTQADIGRTFTYTIKEVVPTAGENGMTYDPLVVTIQVQVTDAGNGELAVTPVYSADTEFNNVYVAEGSFQPAVRKVLTGRELAAGEFTFALKRNGTVLQTKTNAADGTVTFDPILYTQDDIGQTYAYTIVEVVPGSPETGMSYDALVVTITVDIADAGHGALTVTPHYPADTEFDNAYAASGSWNPQVTKKLEGRVLKNGEFSFLLKDVGGNVLQTKTNTAGGQVIFDAVSYSQADIGKTFTYTIEEVVPATPESGMTYDPMILTVTVQVTDVGNGQLAITPGYPADTEFNNVYTAQGSFTPTVRKVLAGRVLAAGEFTFALKRNGTVLQTKTNAADGTVTFDPIPYGQDDIGQTYTYTIVEVVPGSPETGMTYDALVVTITVDIEDAGGGLLTVTPHYPADTEFNNAYTASGSWTPQVTKTLEGRTLKNGEFSFQLKDEDGNVLQTKTNAAGGQVVFDAVNYSQADIGKTFTYTIEEVVPAAPEGGMTYDPMVVTVTVQVTDAGNGQLAITPSYPADTEFNNIYAAEGSFTPTVRKVLAGRELAAGEFTFALKRNGTVLQTKTNAADGTVTFDPIHYTQDDIGQTYAYTIIELVPGSPETGMTYDALVVTITVDIADAGGGLLTVTPHYPADTEFNNAYAASGSWTPQVTKTLEGRTLKNGEFSFQLKDGDGNVLQTKTNTAGGQVVFDAINYSQADIGKTFTYTVEELVPATAEGGMAYDPLVVTIQVQVTDAGGGQLAITPVYPNDTEFINVYTAEGSFTPIVRKALAGRVLAAGEFSFVLKKDGTVLQTKTNAADGTVTFDPILYTQDDIGQTYTYTIVELVPGSPEAGMTYDDLVVTITVDIEDAGGGLLTVTPHYPTDTEFNNAYTASGSWTPQVTKKLTGRDLADGEFSFLLKDAEGNILQTRTNAAGGQVTFGAIAYSQADIGKTFTYTIVEEVPAAPEGGMTYDPMVVTITVQVTDAGGGALLITPSYPDDTEFNNAYTAWGGFTPMAMKVLTGRALGAGEFSFQLKDEDGNVLQTKTNAAGGTVTFDSVYYSQDDIGATYSYTIEEVVPASPEAGMTYDPRVLTVTVNITDEGGGILLVHASYEGGVDFNNVYEATGSFTPEVSKELAGRSLTAGEFSFVLKDADGNVLQTKTNTAGGQVLFDAVSYTQADIGQTFTYTITEVVPAVPEPGMAYDPMTVTVTVTVTDAGGGVLTVVPTYPSDRTFNNTYTAHGSWTPYASKTLAGRELAAGEFTFVLKKDGTVIQTRTNAADGSISFDTIAFNQGDIGQTYIFTIEEVVPAAAEGGMVYDPMVVTIPVTITDAGGGVLTVSPVYPQDMEFNNTYSAEGSFQPAVTKVLTGRELLAGEFSFALIHEGTALEIAANAADGTVTFGALAYTQADIGRTFTYTIEELVPAVPEGGMTYDPMTVTLTVTVTDAGGGLLNIAAVYSEDTEFNNRYQAFGEWTPEVSKELTAGGRLLGDGEFTFELRDEDGLLLQTRTNRDTGQVLFGSITYNELAIGHTYTYTITELVPAVPEVGMTYDPMVLTITVDVADAGDGELAVTVHYPEDTVFNNVYEAYGEWIPEVGKVLLGRDLADGEFIFELRDAEDNVIGTAANDADGRVVFAPFTFSEEDIGGVFNFSIVEVVPAAPEGGMTYDPMVVYITVVVNDAGDGALDIYAGYPEDTVFNNRYEAANSLLLEGWKELIGRAIEEGAFTFLLKDEDGNILETTVNAMDGSFGFVLDYTEEDIGKTYVYTIEEEAGTEGGMVYDGRVITVTVAVTDAGHGILDLDVTMSGDIYFENTYTAHGSYQPEVGKILTGRPLEAGEFEFELVDEDGNVLQTVSNQEDGTVLFDPLVFDQDDAWKNFVYTVREKDGGHGNIVYDGTVFVLTLAVEDHGDGVLGVYRWLEEEDIVFTNIWEIMDVTATKTWIGGYEEKPVIWFKLMRQIGMETAEAVPGADLLKLDGITEVTWHDQAIYAPGGETYIYSVREVDAAGNPLTLVDHLKIEDGLNVTNEFIGERVSPTGERSPALFVGFFAGMSLFLGAAGVFLARKRRQEETGS